MLPVISSAGLPMVGFSLKPSPAEGPYQDAEFLEQANMTIYSLSNQSVPTGTPLRDLQTVQQKLSKMSISPEQYSFASDVNAFLYYTGKAGNEYGDAISLTNSPYSPVGMDGAQYAEANNYYLAAKTVWERIKDHYPDVTLYTLSESSDGTSDETSDDFIGFGNNQGSRGHTGLW
jgi:hypothetical protein